MPRPERPYPEVHIVSMRDKGDCLVPDLNTLRKLFKGLEYFRAASEDHGIDVIVFDGVEYHLLDVEMLYRASQTLLAARQREAIRLHLVGNRKESDVAIEMGIAPSNPIGMYATDGLRHIMSMLDDNLLP